MRLLLSLNVHREICRNYQMDNLMVYQTAHPMKILITVTFCESKHTIIQQYRDLQFKITNILIISIKKCFLHSRNKREHAVLHQSCVSIECRRIKLYIPSFACKYAYARSCDLVCFQEKFNLQNGQ